MNPDQRYRQPIPLARAIGDLNLFTDPDLNRIAQVAREIAAERRPDRPRQRHRERLEAGTGTLPPMGTPENAANWQTWYSDRYIRKAQREAREHLAHYTPDDND